MGVVSARPPRWNHNLHYHRVILAAVPDGARRSLDVGCGVGMLARDLRRVVPHVTAIDRDAASIAEARREDAGTGVDYVVGDFMTDPSALSRRPSVRRRGRGRPPRARAAPLLLGGLGAAPVAAAGHLRRDAPPG